MNVVNPNWVTLQDWPKTGRTWPASVEQWRALLRKRHQNGLDAHVSKVGKTILINEFSFVEQWIPSFMEINKQKEITR